MMPAVLVALGVVTLTSLVVPRATTVRTDRLSPHRDPSAGVAGRAATRLGSWGALVWSARGRVTSCRPEAVASWCDALARSVRAGSTLRAAVATVHPDDQRVAEVVGGLQRGLERGDSIAAIMRSHHAHDGDRHLDAARDVIGVIADLGGSSAAPLDRVAAALRMRAADEHQRSAHAAQARMSSKVLTVVPVAVLGVLVATDPDVGRTVMRPAGAACITVGLLLNVAGNRWMRRMIDGAR